jgi:hypothetical protein
MCVLVKDCIIRSTKAGDLVVVIDHIRAEDDVVEELTLLVFDQSAASAANTVARFYAKADGHTREEIQAKDMAMRRAKTRTEPLNHAKLRAVHADYRKDLLGEAESPQTSEADAELREKAAQIIGQSARIQLVFCENDEESQEMVDVAVVAVAGSAVKVALTFSRNGRSERRIMSADRAFDLMPPQEVLFKADFVASRTYGYLRCMPKSKAASNIDQLVSAEEVVRLVEGLGFRCPQRNVPLARANVQARAVRAAFTLDDAVLRAHANRVDLPQIPVETLSVESMIALLSQLKNADMYGAERQRMPPPPARTPAPACPRANALKSAAESDQAFKSFITAVLPWFIDSSMLAAVSAHDLTQLASLEAWLEKAGAHADPSQIRSDMAVGSQSEAMLVAFAFKLAGIVNAQAASSTPSNTSAAAGLITHQVIQPDREGTELERAERTGLAQKAAEVMGSAELQRTLQELSRVATVQGHEDELFEKVTSEEMRGCELYPLLNTGEDISKAVAGHLSPPLLMQVLAVRGALARRIERAYIFNDTDVTPAQRVRAALHNVRIGRVSKLKLLHLLDKDDAGTIEHPLKQFESLDEAQADAVYAQAINALTHAWQLCTPADSAAVMRFCGRLGSFTATQRQLGASWPALSKFHAAVFKKVDEESMKYAISESRISRASPRIDWIDAPSKYHLALNAAVSERTSIRAAEKAIAKLTDDLLKTLRSQLPKTSTPVSRDVNDDGTVKPKKPKKKRPRGKPGDATATTSTTSKPPPAAAKETAEARKLRVAEEMLAKHGDKNGKPPCYFHFRDGGVCKFSAAQCNMGHHGDDP